jgi:hypothetical protein
MSDTLELKQAVPDTESDEVEAHAPALRRREVAHQDRRQGIRSVSALPPDRFPEGRPRPGRHRSSPAERTYGLSTAPTTTPTCAGTSKGPKKRKFGDPRLDAGETEVPVCNYFIAARLLAGNDRFERVLREAGKMTRAAGDMWVLRSKQTIQQLRSAADLGDEAPTSTSSS